MQNDDAWNINTRSHVVVAVLDTGLKTGDPDRIGCVAANGTDIVNQDNDPIMDPALDYAYNNGVTVVCATGNDGSRKNVSYPAIYPSTIGVGAVDFQPKVTRYSNKGEGSVPLGTLPFFCFSEQLI